MQMLSKYHRLSSFTATAPFPHTPLPLAVQAPQFFLACLIMRPSHVPFLLSWCSLPPSQLTRLAGLPQVIFPDCLVCPSHWAKLLEGRMRNCSALVSSSQQCLVPQNSGG